MEDSMKNPSPKLFSALFVALALTLTGCAPDAPNGSGSAGNADSGADSNTSENGSDSGSGGGSEGGSSNAADGGSNGNGGTSGNAGRVDTNGFVIPGSPIEIGIGDSVTYYSMPQITQEDAQKVSITGYKYYEFSDIPEKENAPSKLDSGILVLNVSWTSVLGKTQSNQGYILVKNDDTGEEAVDWAFLSDRLKNGGVPENSTRTGTITKGISPGNLTITIVDYVGEPVAFLKINVE